MALVSPVKVGTADSSFFLDPREHGKVRTMLKAMVTTHNIARRKTWVSQHSELLTPLGSREKVHQRKTVLLCDG